MTSYIYYYTPGSISLAAHIALQMSALDYSAVAIDFSTNEQKSDAFLQINPLGRVPALVVKTAQETQVITETVAILNFVVRSITSEDSPLYTSVNSDALFQAKIDAFNSYLSSTVHVSHAHMRRGERWVDSAQAKAEMVKKAPMNLTSQFALIEDHWFVGPWVHGDVFSISDIYLFVITRWLPGDEVDPKQFPKVYQHSLQVAQLPQVSQLLGSLYR